MLRAESETFFDAPVIEGEPIVEDKKTSSLIANLKEFAPSIDLVSGRYAGSVLGPELLIEGTLESTGLVEIFGTVNGDVRGAAVTVAETGVVNGSIEAKILMVNGRVTGDLRASEVELGPTAQVDGNIHQRSIIMAKGARFEGRATRMTPVATPEVIAAEQAVSGKARALTAQTNKNLLPMKDGHRPVPANRVLQSPLRAAS